LKNFFEITASVHALWQSPCTQASDRTPLK
jgi:hypothetical protein